MASTSAILPGATLGILGGGQLGRMMAMAARSLGYHILALDPDPSCAARFVVERCLAASFDDEFAAAVLARASQVVTIEIEQIALRSMEAAAHYAPVRPGPSVLRYVQDRALQKRWLKDHGFPVGPYREATTREELVAAVKALGGDCYVKIARGGYDGRGQARIHHPAEANAAWDAIAGPCVVEQALPLEAELSVLVARRPSGAMAVYPVALNHHEHRILAWSVLPGPVSDRVATEAATLARGIAEGLGVEGLLVVELFLLGDGRLLVNELAPRPHNSYHASEIACATSQFEQAVRAVCDLPLGSVEVVRPAAIANLLGELWLGAHPPSFDAALAIPGVRLHLYGKRVPRPGRKMGHLSASGASPQEAVAKVKAALERLTT
ncbi:MAG TPA: 5-(carboxyamino)imidazole ribonucleotide synthase [Polyangia bacterium]|jgi:5-(carboxyamino)imidazole ribonucleotide synthase|nr:5-(carboxyamino)imidazole ribonucleotide synthase [Polyangia bacterium]